ncbi:MAG: hypothetical protein V4466_11530 [Pseudomonadota bacterium]
MAVVINDVELEAPEMAPPQDLPAGGGGQARRKLDPEELAAVLRRRADRETRLWTD